MKPAVPEKTGFTRIDPSALAETAHFSLRFDENTGAIVALVRNMSGREWASNENPLGLFHYETFAQQDYDRYLAQYTINMESCAAWAIPDLSKPGMAAASAEHHHWYPTLTGSYLRKDAAGSRYLLEMTLPAKSTSKYGAPAKVVLAIDFPVEAPVIGFNLQWFNKPANRLPEAFWFSFQPRIANPGGWSMDKMCQNISPLEVVSKGNRKLHAVISGVNYADEAQRLIHRNAGCPAGSARAAVTAQFRQPATADGQRHALQPLQQHLGHEFPHVVRRRRPLQVRAALWKIIGEHSVAFRAPGISIPPCPLNMVTHIKNAITGSGWA